MKKLRTPEIAGSHPETAPPESSGVKNLRGVEIQKQQDEKKARDDKALADPNATPEVQV